MTGIPVSYERRLTFSLRLRGLTEPEIAEELEKVRAQPTVTGTVAEAGFRAASEYAKQFPQKKRQTRGRAIATIGGVLAIAYILLMVLLMFFKIDIRDYVGPAPLLPGLLLILTGALAGFLTDYFQPVRVRSSDAQR